MNKILFTITLALMLVLPGVLATTYSGVSGINDTLDTPVKSISLTGLNQTWLNFDGINDKVQVDYNQQLNVTITNETTACIWHYSTDESIGTSDDQLFYTFAGGGWHVFLDYSATKYWVGWKSTAAANKGSNSVNDYTTGSWQHFCFSADFLRTSSNMNYLINGKSDKIGNANDGIYTGNQDLYIGLTNANANDFNGSIDEIMVFNRSLSGLEIMSIYGNSSKGNYERPIPVFSYHNITDAGDSSIYTVNITDFKSHLELISALGYESITDLELHNWSNDQGFTLPEKPIILRFDDGYLSMIDKAAPLMANYSYRGIVGITIDYVDTNDHMSWENISSLNTVYNWSIAGHSVSHCNHVLVCNTTVLLEKEINGSKNAIFGNISITPKSYIAPAGAWDDSVAANVSLYYDLFFGNSAEPLDYMSWNYKSTNLTDGSLRSIALRNASNTLERLNFNLNQTNYMDSIVLYLNLNQNSSSDALDSSGNGNNGTITGASWDNDGVLIPITDYLAYKNSTNTWLVFGDNSLYQYFTASYTEQSSAEFSTCEGSLAGLQNFGTMIPIVIIVIVFSIVLLFLVGQTGDITAGGTAIVGLLVVASLGAIIISSITGGC